MTDPDFYRAFEDRHRGSRELIKFRLQAYEPFVKPLLDLESKPRLLDLGCGRGEWLELSGEWGFDASGVDLSDGMLDACRKLGLQASSADALQTLRAQDDQSVALVSAFHLIEHMAFNDVRALVSEAHRILRPGGLLILETPNPENLVVGASNFYLDPTHIRPVPPLLLSYATEFAGFFKNKIVRLQEQAIEPRSIKLWDVLGGVSPDYAVVAQKGGPSDVLRRFDRAFEANLGVSLNDLAQAYDHKWSGSFGVQEALAWAASFGVQEAVAHERERSKLADRRAEQADSRAHLLETRLRQVESQLHAVTLRGVQTDARAQRSDARADAAERHATHANARAAELELLVAAKSHELHALRTSTSWRLAAPIRWAGAPFSRISSALKQGRIKSGLKSRAKRVIRFAALGLARRPALKRAAAGCLGLMPGVRDRLKAALVPPVSHPILKEGQPSAEELSVDANMIYRRLTKSQRAQERSQ